LTIPYSHHESNVSGRRAEGNDMAGSTEAIVRDAGKGERRWFYGGGLHTWKCTAEETGGAFALLEDVMTEGKTTPLHLHPHCDEAVYVLEGELLLQVEGVDHRVGTGGFAFVPRATEHALLVTSPTARVLAFMAPGGTDRFFLEASVPTDDSADGEVDFGRVVESAERTGSVEILGPPPFAR
jgi:quercetin dioxygenase-like cupin family protein